jgi:hypothetical protein
MNGPLNLNGWDGGSTRRLSLNRRAPQQLGVDFPEIGGQGQGKEREILSRSKMHHWVTRLETTAACELISDSEGEGESTDWQTAGEFSPTLLAAGRWSRLALVLVASRPPRGTMYVHDHVDIGNRVPLCEAASHKPQASRPRDPRKAPLTARELPSPGRALKKGKGWHVRAQECPSSAWICQLNAGRLVW